MTGTPNISTPKPTTAVTGTGSSTQSSGPFMRAIAQVKPRGFSQPGSAVAPQIAALNMSIRSAA